MLKCYKPKRFNKGSVVMIERANKLLEFYEQNGISCTLRSLYYRFVANNWLPNQQKAYKRLGSILGDARLAGRMRWDIMEDKTRRLAGLQHFDGPQDALDKLASWYHVDMWANQAYRPEVWIEKDAVAGNVERACEENDVPFFSCRGYTSLTEMWRGSERMRYWINQGQTPYIIHLGDHDPSGIDMSRDITERMRATFMANCQFKRLALNMDQINKYKPPPNPAKVTDSRYKGYIENFGKDSWELDALDPLEFYKLVSSTIEKLKDKKQWEEDSKEKERVQAKLKHIAANWDKPPPTPQTRQEAEREVKKWKLSDAHISRVVFKTKPKKKGN